MGQSPQEGLHKLRARKRHYKWTKIRAWYWFLCVKIIWIYQCVLLFFFGYVLGCLLLSFIVLSSLLPRCAALIFCFNISRFCSPAINQISLRQSKGWFPFILICRWEKHCLLGLCINYADICISWKITSM